MVSVARAGWAGVINPRGRVFKRKYVGSRGGPRITYATMPVRRFSWRRRNMFRQATYFGRGGRGFIGPQGENKYIDWATDTYQCDTTGEVFHLDVVPLGNTVNQRDGRKFMPTWVNIRGILSNLPTATQNHCAVILVWDTQPAKVLAALTDLLDTASSESQNKRENASRFKVVRRWDVMLTGKGDASTTPGFSRTFNKYVFLPKGLIAECTPADTTGVIGNRVSGALLLFTVGQTAAGTAAAVLNCTIRVGFKDI